MKSRLRLLFYNAVVLCALISTNKGHSQINYSQDFNGTGSGWAPVEFALNTAVPCEGAKSFRASLFDDFELPVLNAQLTSPSIGVSNGGQATLTFQYKLVHYAGGDLNVPVTNDSNWGVIKVYYATAAAGPFTEISQITPATHTESAICSTKTVTFIPPVGSQVFIRVGIDLGNLDTDYLMYFDDVHVTQADAVVCAGTPDVSTAIAQNSIVCNGADASLSLSPAYTTIGLTYQWQSSTDGVAYSDIAGETGVNLVNSQTVSTWYRANVTCTASGESVTSVPVEVVSSGLPCLCEVAFDVVVTPITLVEFAGINNETPSEVNETPANENFTTTVTSGQVVAGSSYPIVLEGNTGDTFGEGVVDFYKVFIDFNHNGDFSDAGESFEVGTITDGSDGTDGIQATGTIAIPATATLGLTYMRVFKMYGEYTQDPCTPAFGIGQAEDYFINIACGTVVPEVAVAQSFCKTATVDDLIATGTEIKWYQDETEGTPLSETFELVNEGVYYVSQTIGCESSRVMVTVTINTVDAPSGDDTITDATGTLLLSQIELEATGTITWYANTEDAASGENALPGSTVVPSGSTTYYATQTIGDCESEAFAVTVDVVLGAEDFDLASFSYYPNPVNDVLNVSYSSTITAVTVFNLLGQQIVAKNTNQDTVQVDLSQLAAGTYMVKIQSEEAFKVIKIVKN